jgi:predicted Zn-dependent protease
MEAHYARFATRFRYPARPPEGRITAAGRIYIAENKHNEARQLAVAYKNDYPTAAEQLINSAGYDLMRRRELQQAVAMFRDNAVLFPNSPNVYDSLADAYCRAENVSRARETIHEAVRVAEQRSDPRLNRYRERLEKPCG